MSASLLLSWCEGVSSEVDADGALRVQGPRGSVVLRRLAPALLTALEALASPGAAEDSLSERILETGDAGALAAWYYTVQGLARRGLLCRTLHADGRRLAALLPTSPSFAFASSRPLSDTPCLLSRFACLRRDGGAMVLESPLAPARLIFDDDRATAVVGALMKPRTASELSARGGHLSVSTVASLLGLLAEADMLQHDEDGERESSALSCWEFHDLLFHARSRKGRGDAPFGATYRMAGRMEPPPAVASFAESEMCDLHRPDLEQLCRDDPPFAEIVERRRSIRDYDVRPLTIRQVGEFLYRVARVKDRRAVDLATPSGPVRMEFISRPYPSGGALYELEFYVAVQACDGLEPGLYHYDGLHHRLALRCGRTTEIVHLLSDAAASSGIPAESVQVLFVLAARFPRLAWKYSSIAYALILKHVGVVYQTMYLTAAAMNLAPCALGGGDADLFARAAGTDYYEETSVGEFLLGSARKTDEMNREAEREGAPFHG